MRGPKIWLPPHRFMRTKEMMAKWLASLPSDREVGEILTAESCPLATFIGEKLYRRRPRVHDIQVFSNYYVYRRFGVTFHRYLPQWARLFLSTIDRSINRDQPDWRVSAGHVRRSLSYIGGGTSAKTIV